MSDTPTHRWRTEAVFGLLLLALVGLSVRLVLLMRDQRGRALQVAQQQQLMVVPLPGRIGSIRGTALGSFPLLAGSRPSPLCYADPSLMDEREWSDASLTLAEILGHQLPLPQRQVLRWELLGKISQRRDWGRRYVVLQRNLSDWQVEQIRQLKLPAVGIHYEWSREYPCGPLASAIVGFRQRNGKPGGGLELAMESHLQASDGRRLMLADAQRRPIWPLDDGSSQPQDGSSVYLTIDLNIQEILTQAVCASVEKYKAEWGTGIVINPHTGEILAMCSAPTFDPNDYASSRPEDRNNRVITAPVEPGSVLKPLYAAMAVQMRAIGWNDIVDCGDGTYTVRGGGRVGDHGKEYGRIPLWKVIVVSSNIGMAKLGELLGNEKLYQIATLFGFGSKTGICLPGESPGILRPLRRWDGYSLRRVPFGQEISVTALQLTMAYGALANGGILLPPRLIHHITRPDGTVVEPEAPAGRRVLHEQVARSSIDIMQQVVDHEDGTGHSCRLSQWTSFGKTGTAQVPDGPRGYNDRDYMGSFIGGAPVSKPAVICLISIYKPDRTIGYYGGTVAAPYVRDVLEKTLHYLNVPPDKPLEPLARVP